MHNTIFDCSLILSSLTSKGQGIAYEASWAAKMETWAQQWDHAGEKVYQAALPYNASTYTAYLRWYHSATCWRCFPFPEDPEPHHAEITDTFATEPLAAFHVLVSAQELFISNQLLTVSFLCFTHYIF